MRKLSQEEFVDRVNKKHGNEIKILSTYLGYNQPITYMCREGKHKVTVSKAARIIQAGCNVCGDNTLKKYSYKSRSKDEKFPIKNKKYILPPPFNCYYLVWNKKWNVFSSNGQLESKPSVKGYESYGLVYKIGQQRTIYLHRMVYALKIQNWKFLNKVKEGWTVDHKDRNPANNHPKNIRLCNWSEQNYNRSTTVVTDKKVLNKILRLIEKGWSQQKVADKLNCSQGAIHSILKRHNNKITLS